MRGRRSVGKTSTNTWSASTDIALVQVGDDTQDEFLKEAAEPLLAKLRSASP